MNQQHNRRLSRLQSAVSNAGLDAFLVSSTDSMYYLTGLKYEPFERVFFIVIRPQGLPIILTPRIEAENMASIAIAHTIVEYDDFPAQPGATYLDALATIVSSRESIGVEPSMPSGLLATLTRYQTQVRALIEGLRLVKSADEIKRIRRAAHYSDLGIRMLMDVCKMGRSADDAYAQIAPLRDAVIAGEGEFDQYISSIWLGVWAAPFSAQPHRFPEKSDVIKEGPNVGLSFLRVNGYSAETERTFFAHPPSKEQAGVFACMLEAGQVAYRMLRPGVSAHDIDHAVMSFLRNEGFADNLLHRTGHGIGMGGHEGPWVAEGSDDVLQENMVISIEPGIYWRGQGGYRHSDSVLITADGYQKLSDVPTDIDAMTLCS